MASTQDLLDLIDANIPVSTPDESQEIRADDINATLKAIVNEMAARLPAGGDEGQILAKASDEDFDLEWIDAGEGVGTLAAPQNFAGTTADGHSVLTWDASPNATGYIVSKDGTPIYTGSLLTFDATSLTNGTQYTFTVVATALGYNNSPAASINVTPSAGAITGYYLIAVDGSIPTESEILAGTAFSITDGADYEITFPSTGWLKVFEPSTQPEKVKNIDPVFGVDAFGPDGTFAAGTTVAAFRGYISNYPTGPATIAFNQ